MKRYIAFVSILVLCSCTHSRKEINQHKQLSGVYPHLAFYNDEGECGTGAIVPWGDRLWVITYSPHMPFGSSDKLYEMTKDLVLKARGESIGGTVANRMIHKESNQLFIGPYAIDSNRNVRSIPYSEMPGRHTGNAKHLKDPKGKIYFATMEEGFYEVDTRTLIPNELYKDGNIDPKKKNINNEANEHLGYADLPGAHGKGLYSGQGVLVYSNNGERSQEALKKFDVESGSLSEWDGVNWKLIRRNQFVEVTGPGGIHGNINPDKDPIWATGWDHKSIILGVRNPKTGWSFYRLPKTSHTYDGAHGWNTEWPRIRNIGTEKKPDYLMTMHGMFWGFPGTFSQNNSGGIQPRSSYLKVIGDFTLWENQLVFGCDDSAQKEFLNKRKAKGGIEGPGQSNSNLWFTSLDMPDKLGPSTAQGGVWLDEGIEAGEQSEPFIFNGWDSRIVWIHNNGDYSSLFNFEVDRNGDNQWEEIESISLKKGEAKAITFTKSQVGEWVRVVSSTKTRATVHFCYSEYDKRGIHIHDPIFEGLANVNESDTKSGLFYGLGNNRRTLGFLSGTISESIFNENGYYELTKDLILIKKKDPETASFIRNKFAISGPGVSIDDASVLVIDDLGRRWRLPKGNKRFNDLVDKNLSRICREVATERDLFNCGGTFYELPAENADGFAKIRPISSHDFQIFDYTSYRGLLLLSGVSQDLPKSNKHIITSDDGKAALWAGVIDDLWKLGKPIGHGGPWKDSPVKANIPSDQYLIGHYDKKKLKLSHKMDSSIKIKIEIDPIGHGPWMNFMEVYVKPGETFTYEFPSSFFSRWIRFVANKDCVATAWLEYN